MIEEQYDILLELQEIDINFDEEERKKRNLPSKIKGVTREILELKGSLKNKNEDYKNLQIKLKRKEMDLSDEFMLKRYECEPASVARLSLSRRASELHPGRCSDGAKPACGEPMDH